LYLSESEHFAEVTDSPDGLSVVEEELVEIPSEEAEEELVEDPEDIADESEEELVEVTQSSA
jgi:hypothetical protein